MQSKAHVSKAMTGRRTLNENDEFESWCSVWSITSPQGRKQLLNLFNYLWNTRTVLSSCQGLSCSVQASVQHWPLPTNCNSHHVNVGSTTQVSLKFLLCWDWEVKTIGNIVHTGGDHHISKNISQKTNISGENPAGLQLNLAATQAPSHTVLLVLCLSSR